MWSTAIALTDARWRKSSRSNAGGAQCVEMAHVEIGTAVRDSKAPAGPALIFSPAAFAHFVAGLKRG